MHFNHKCHVANSYIQQQFVTKKIIANQQYSQTAI